MEYTDETRTFKGMEESEMSLCVTEAVSRGFVDKGGFAVKIICKNALSGMQVCEVT